MGMMNRRDVLRLAAPIAAGTKVMRGSACQSTLDPRTVSEYEAYVKTARGAAEQPIGSKPLSRVPDEQRAAAMHKLESDHWFVWNLQEKRPHGALSLYKAVVVDWMGALLLPGVTVGQFEGVLQNYDAYKNIYKPYIF